MISKDHYNFSTMENYRINHFCRGRVLIGLVAGFVLTTVIAIVFMKSSWGYQDELDQTKREIEAILMEKEGAREEAESFKQQAKDKEILLKKLQDEISALGEVSLERDTLQERLNEIVQSRDECQNELRESKSVAVQEMERFDDIIKQLKTELMQCNETDAVVEQQAKIITNQVENMSSLQKSLEETRLKLQEQIKMTETYNQLASVVKLAGVTKVSSTKENDVVGEDETTTSEDVSQLEEAFDDEAV
ncbi:uncharacterized protein LOC143463315 [Clavelina lepadiformis]|uniref:uncharacterized protein LOC143463315 n=1 Tax=Clavelina lepadiformis TaxID=159417 RepID=UPI0040419A69